MPRVLCVVDEEGQHKNSKAGAQGLVGSKWQNQGLNPVLLLLILQWHLTLQTEKAFQYRKKGKSALSILRRRHPWDIRKQEGSNVLYLQIKIFVSLFSLSYLQQQHHHPPEASFSQTRGLSWVEEGQAKGFLTRASNFIEHSIYLSSLGFGKQTT